MDLIVKRAHTHATFLALLVAAALVPGCEGDSGALTATPDAATDGAPPDAAQPDGDSGKNTLPSVPEPASVNELMPDRSASLIIGLSAELGTFYPQVSELEMMQDDGSLKWTTVTRRTDDSRQNRILLACPEGVACSSCLPMITGQPGSTTNATYISARPRLLHLRHWRRVVQSTVSPGAAYSFNQSVTWGTSTTHETSVSFSQTLGVSATIGGAWKALSGSITASFSQTTTATEIHSVSFWEETSEERTFTVNAPASGTRVFVVWQLVDEFAMVDADKAPIDESPTLVHVRMPPVPSIQFPNDRVVTLKTTDFK
jgi:hypothetical protein